MLYVVVKWFFPNKKLITYLKMYLRVKVISGRDLKQRNGQICPWASPLTTFVAQIAVLKHKMFFFAFFIWVDRKVLGEDKGERWAKDHIGWEFNSGRHDARLTTRLPAPNFFLFQYRFKYLGISEDSVWFCFSFLKVNVRITCFAPNEQKSPFPLHPTSPLSKT